MMTQEQHEQVQRLKQKHAEMLDPLDIPGDWTPRRRDSYETTRCIIDGRLRDALAASTTLAQLAPKIAADTKWLADANTCRPTLCDELLAFGHPRTDLERGRVRNLTLSIQMLDRGRRVADGTGWMLETSRLGELMRELGYTAAPPFDGAVVGLLPWFGSIPVVEQRLRDLTAQHDEAQARFDAALREELTVTS
jgi:hypothetical protein